MKVCKDIANVIDNIEQPTCPIQKLHNKKQHELLAYGETKISKEEIEEAIKKKMEENLNVQ